jgi:hypothetical protein
MMRMTRKGEMTKRNGETIFPLLHFVLFVFYNCWLFFSLKIYIKVYKAFKPFIALYAMFGAG